jgi:hypothetical protein
MRSPAIREARPHSNGFLRNKNAALPARAQKSPLTLSGLKKHESRLAPAATNFRATFSRPGFCQGRREKFPHPLLETSDESDRREARRKGPAAAKVFAKNHKGAVE